MRPTARLWETFAVVALLGTLGGVCWAAEEAKESAKLPQASGEIASVDALGGVLTLKASTTSDSSIVPQPTSFLVDEKTVISRDQQPLKLADVRVGDAVTVEYATKDGKNMASSITIQSPTGAKSEQTVAAPAAKSPTTSSAQ